MVSMIEVTNEQKIALLELLGYFIGDGDVIGKYYKEGKWLYISEFNPLDIVILTRVLDVIEKGGCSTNIEFDSVSNKYFLTIYYSDNTRAILSEHIGDTREEAILKTVLAYLETKKK